MRRVLMAAMVVAVWWTGIGLAYCQLDSIIKVRVERPKGDAVPRSVSNLSPELLAVKLSGGTLVGNTPDGEVLLKGTTERGLQDLMAHPNTKNISKVAPPEQNKIVTLRLSYDAATKPTAEQLKTLGLELVEDYVKGTFLIVKPDKPIDAELLKKLEATKSLQLVSPVMKIKPIKPQAGKKPVTNKLSATPNDPRLGDLWGMQNCRAVNAWNTVTSGKTVVAVIDTGVDYNHEDLKSTMWVNPSEVAGDGLDNDGNGIIDDVYGADFINADGDPMDDNSHGTHCSGTISGIGNNALGVAGVNWGTPIMALKWLDAGGSGSSVEAIKCIDYAIDHGVRVLSNSWWHPDDPELKEAIVRARDAGALFIVAAGNFTGNNDDPSEFTRYPSAYDVENIISVAAIDSSEAMAGFSSFGATTVDIGGPGVDVLSSIPSNQYDFFSGTSMATPHVAGAAALIWNNPAYASSTWSEVQSLILSHARPIPALTGKCVTGGVLDLSFMAPSTPGAGNQVSIVNTNFGPGEKKLSRSNFTIAELDVDLKSPAMVSLTGNSSISSVGDLLDTHLTSTAGDWLSAVRFVTLPAGEWTNITISHATVLPAGKHRLSWLGFVNEDATLDGGSLVAMIVSQPEATTSGLTASALSSQPRSLQSGGNLVRIREASGRLPLPTPSRSARQPTTTGEKRTLKVTLELAP